MAHPRTTRTQARLHFDDLDPRRFEDLIRQLAFDFRPWRSLEAVGESGSDDGLDARGHEIFVVDPSTGLPSADASPQQDRLWVIQCKREKRLGPQDVEDIVNKAVDGAGGSIYGLILAASTTLSKRARDKLDRTAKARAVQEAYFWDQAELDDMLFQVRFQQLLFVYFGISLHGSSQRGAIFTNLRWELGKTIASLVRRSDDVPRADVLALRSLRRRLRLTSSWLAENSGAPVQVSLSDARRILIFWSATMGTVRDIKTDAIRQAIASGEFLEVDPASSARVSGTVDLDLRRLADAIERYVALSERGALYVKVDGEAA